MPVYRYQARDRGTGRARSDQLTADSPLAARDELRRLGLLAWELTELRPEGQALPAEPAAAADAPGTPLSSAHSGLWEGLRSQWGRARRATAVAEFTRQATDLLEAGVPLAEALEVLVRQGGPMETVLRDLAEQIRRGVTLAAALRRHPRWFDPLAVALVEIGEAAGELETVLGRLAELQQRSLDTRGKLQAALAYPALLAVVTLAVVVFLLTGVVPRILAMLEETGRPLPLATQVLWGLSAAATEYGPLTLGGLVAVGVGWTVLLRRPTFRLWWDRRLLRLPMLGRLLARDNLSSWAEVTATLLKAGVPLDQALEMSAGPLSNHAVRQAVRELASAIVRGENLAAALGQSPTCAVVFPPVVAHLLAVGEETGRLEGMLSRIAQAGRQETELALRRALSVAEPLLIVIMASVVGFIVLAVMLPILELSQVQ